MLLVFYQGIFFPFPIVREVASYYDNWYAFLLQKLGGGRGKKKEKQKEKDGEEITEDTALYAVGAVETIQSETTNNDFDDEEGSVHLFFFHFNFSSIGPEPDILRSATCFGVVSNFFFFPFCNYQKLKSLISFFSRIGYGWKYLYRIISQGGAKAKNILFFGSSSRNRARVQLRNTVYSVVELEPFQA